MFYKRTSALTFFTAIGILSAVANTTPGRKGPKTVAIHAPKMDLLVDYTGKASITSLVVNGQSVISNADGVFTSLKVNGITYSSLHLKAKPYLAHSKNEWTLSGIKYGDKNLTINETWVFTVQGSAVKWGIKRSLSKPVKVEEANLPQFNFASINTWDGAYQGYGGLAWFYLFNEKLCTYGVHTRLSDFWNSKTGNGLRIVVDAPGKQVAMKYSRTNNDELAYSISVSDKEMGYKLDSGTNRRRFLRKRTDVWAPFTIKAGSSYQRLTLSYFNFNDDYGRGKIVGINGQQVGAVLNTIARIGVIDSLHYGGNSWATPYGPICLHEQYIGQLGLAINDPKYLNGYKACLDFYCAHAIKPDGRVYPRWAYTNEDAMPGKFNQYGFYEAQWGILMDSNPDLVTNIAELYDMTGDKKWVTTHQADCEKALDWILNRDSNNNGLVEMMTNTQAEKKSSDWIDIIWASYENAFVNAKLYHALVLWTDIERQLNNTAKADHYKDFAAKLKASFNKSTKDGGFWDNDKKCYVHWVDKDGAAHGNNMVTPVNFMAIAYGICDDGARKKAILDAIEDQMQREKLFFWPICMTTYTKGEGNDWQFPFPAYENGDLFLSWGSIAVKAYADYKPELALKYVKNVLNQYSKDGLAFQRYGRAKQDGLGDDILSGNSLTIVGLYQAIYGINPLYNRFYLNPHITTELSGTELKYNFRGDKLTIHLDSNNYTVSNQRFRVISNKDFGFNATGNQLAYFQGDNASASLQVTANDNITLQINNHSDKTMEWQQVVSKVSSKPVMYQVALLKPNTDYTIAVNGKIWKKVNSDMNGDITFSLQVNDIADISIKE